MKTRRGAIVRRGRNWYVRWKVDGRAYQKALRDAEGIPITTKRDAESARDEFMARFRFEDERNVLEAIAGRVGGLNQEIARIEEAEAETIAIPDVWSAFSRSHTRGDAGDETMHQYQVQVKRWAKWMETTHPHVKGLRDVTKDHAERFIDHLAESKRTSGTINKYLNLLTLVFRVLSEKGRITSNPWEGIARKKLKTVSRRELTVEELRGVCEKAEGELKTLLALGLYSGLRLGDCCQLKWSDVDLVRQSLRVRSSKKGKQVWLGIFPCLLPLLQEAKTGNTSPFVMPGMAADYDRHASYVTARIQSHFIKCGIDTAGTKAGRSRAAVDVGFHSLRHSFVSLLASAGAPLGVVQAMVGHGNPAMTRHYTHIGEQSIRDAIALLPSILGNASQPPENERDAAIIAHLESMTNATLDDERFAIYQLMRASVPITAKPA